MFKKLRTVIYHVKDITAAKKWYAGVTGVQPYFDEAFYVGFDINGCELGLDPDMNNISEGNQTVSYWSVDDVDAALKKLSDSGAAIIQPKTNVGGSTYVAIVKDPSGNPIGIIEE
jgi:predicted enzyme related to lactoylglutathione lyase